MKKVHIVGIAGRLSAPLAKALKSKGWRVSGSDQPNVYPPVTDYLDENKIEYSKGYSPKNISSDLDLVIIAGSALHYDPKNPEVAKAKQLKLPTISQAQAIARFIIKKNSAVIAGTYGKTTTTAMIAEILKEAGKTPGFMYGGMTKNEDDPLAITDSDWSVVEGDEYPTLHFDMKAKFFYYKPKFLLLTACRWEHQDFYKTETEYKNAFKRLTNQVPENGVIAACLTGENVPEVVADASAETVFYASRKLEEVDYWAENKKLTDKGGSFIFRSKKNDNFEINLKILGKHNIENAVGAAGLSRELGIKPEIIASALNKLRGLKRRLEVVYQDKKNTVIRDISQSKPRVRAAISAAEAHFPQKKILAVFYPQYRALRYRESLADYPGMFDRADYVIITKVRFQKGIEKKDRVLGTDIKKEIAKTQPNSEYLPLDKKVVEKVVKYARKNPAVILLMASGNYRNIANKIISSLKKEK